MIVDLTVRIRVSCDSFPDDEELSGVRDMLMEDYGGAGVDDVEILDVSEAGI